jgi:Mlc titration factor MtfA (ptsG expression regulator)
MILARWRRMRETRVLRRRAIPDALWDATLARYPFLAQRDAADRDELRRLATLFLARKEFHGAQGFVVGDEVAVAIAAQACLPVLRLGLDWYDGFVGIVVHSDQVVALRRVMDEDGVVHEYDEPLAGEAMQGGPVMLSWHDVAEAGASASLGYNVVIHEFAHLIDLRDGVADGMPPLAGAAARERWRDVLESHYKRFSRRVAIGRDTVLDPYGAEGIEEFFAVAVEAFFVAPAALRAEHASLYELFKEFFRQDPASEPSSA